MRKLLDGLDSRLAAATAAGILIVSPIVPIFLFTLALVLENRNAPLLSVLPTTLRFGFGNARAGLLGNVLGAVASYALVRYFTRSNRRSRALLYLACAVGITALAICYDFVAFGIGFEDQIRNSHLM